MNERSTQHLMLLFSVGPTLFACDAEPILEVVPRVKLSQIPHTPTYFSGLLNYGGQPVPVVDFCQLIANRPAQNSLHSRIILFSHPTEGQPALLGVIAEKIIETTFLSLDDFIKSGVKLELHPYLDGIYSAANETVQLVEIGPLFAMLKELPIDEGVQNG